MSDTNATASPAAASSSSAQAPAQRGDFRFTERLRVRWSEIDAQKIVFNGHYLTYFDTAIAGYWRALALPYAAAMAHLDGDLFMRRATLDYRASAHYDDALDVGMRCARIGNSSIGFRGAVFRQQQLLVESELVYVFADPRSQTSRPVPQALREVFLGFEAGEAAVSLKLGSWAELGTHAAALRSAVFIDEQRVDPQIERDGADDASLHAVLFNRLGMALATGRLMQPAPRVAQIGRMAVTPALRGSGIGRRVLDALVDAARARGDGEVVLHAQTGARAFYERAGFAARGTAYLEAGIEHIDMVRVLG